MKKLLIITCLLFSGIVIQAQTQNCKCAVIVKETTEWCEGSRGGLYCLKEDGTKRYKKKDVVVPAIKGTKENPLVSVNGKRYYWRLSKNGNWYKSYLTK